MGTRPATIRDANTIEFARLRELLRQYLAFAAVLLICIPRVSAQTFGGFQGAVSYTNVAYSTYGNPSAAANQVSVVVGYFCSGNYLDLAVADAANEAVEIWCSKGDGTFLQPLNAIPLPNLDTLYTSGPPVATVISITGNTQIAAANLSGNTGSNLEDIVLANFQGPGTITLLKNMRLSNGSGAFTVSLLPSETSATNNLNFVTNEGGSVSIAIGDFNGDGFPDLAVGNINSNYGGTIDVVMNNCNGDGAYNFCAPVSYKPGGIQYIGITAAPLQNSNTGTEDIVATDGGNVYVLLNSGTGIFPCAASSPSNCQAVPISTLYNNAVTGLIARDVNDDGYPDVVVEDQYGDPAVLLNNGAGILGSPATKLPDNYAAVAGLFNSQSSYPGLVLLASGGMMYLPNSTSAAGGSVSFGTPAVIGPYNWRYETGAALATGDFNGYLDVVAVTGDEIHVVLGNGDGTFQTAPSYLESLADPAETTSNASTAIAAVAVGNLHGTANGAMDTVSADVGSANTQYPNAISSLIVRLANANGTLQTGTTIFQAPVTTAHFNSIVLGNYGGAGYQLNGAMDIAALTTTGEIYIFQNDGNGNFTETGDSPISLGFSSLTGAVAGDFAGNGSPMDIAAIGPVTGAESYTSPQSGSVVVFLGTGAGTFKPGVQYQGTLNSSKSGSTFANPAQLAVGILGTTGNQDIVVADSGESYPIQAAGGVWVLQNQGGGTFSGPAQVSATEATCCGGATAGPSYVALGKLFESAYPDIVAATTPGVAGQFLEVLQNKGSYTFQLAAANTYPLGGEVAVADVNNDGNPDVLLFTGDAVQALLNTTGSSSTSGILLPWAPSYTTGPSPALTSTGTQPSLLAVGYLASSPKVPNVVAGDAQPAVDVLLNGANGTGSGPVLASIAITPVDPSITVGATQQFTATGTYSNNSTQDLTSTVTWSSSNTATAAFLSTSSPGLATGVAAGTASISAALGSVSGSTTLTVTPAVAPPPPPPPPPPPSPVEDNETIAVSDTDLVSAFTLSTPINVGAPVAFFSTGGPLAFGGQSGSQQTIAVSNIGQVSMMLDSAVISAGAAFSLSALQCFNGANSTGASSASLHTSAFCTLTVTYTGSSPATDSGTLTFTDNAGLSNLVSTALSGTNNYTQSITLYGECPAGSTCPATTPPAPPATVSVSDYESITVTDTPVVSLQGGTNLALSGEARIAYGQSETLTATVTSNGSGTPAGTVTFTSAGGTVLATVTLNSAGVATYTSNTLPVGVDIISAVYNGNGQFRSSAPTGYSVVVVAAGTTTLLTESSTHPDAGYGTTFTATVAPVTSGTPTGTVTFYNGNTSMGTGALNAGVASYTSDTLPGGSDTITAAYGGNTDYIGSTSNALTPLVADFGMTFSLPTGSLSPGQSATYTMTVTPANGSYNEPVTFSVSGLPAGATVTFNPASVTPGSIPATASVTITAPPLIAKNGPGPYFRNIAPTALAVVLLPFATFRRKRRRGRAFLLIVGLALALASVAGLIGCGGGSGFFDQPPQTYTVTVTGSSGAVQHSTTLTLTVE